MLEWSDLRVFLSIARERTLSGAARKLNVDQSTVGRRLSQLEKAAGARLFERAAGGYALTAAAESVLEHIEQIEGQAITVERKLLGQDARIAGPVRVATSDSFASWFLVKHLVALRSRHPEVWIELVTGNRPLDLARREADISLRLTKPTQPHLVARRLGSAAWAPYASRGYIEQRGRPNLRTSLAGHDVVGFDDELAGTVGAKWLKVHGARGRVVLTCNSLNSQGAAVVAGLGVSALPCVFGDAERSLCRLGNVLGHHDIWLVVHPDLKASARVRAVLEYLSELVHGQSGLLAGKLGPTARKAGK